MNAFKMCKDNGFNGEYVGYEDTDNKQQNLLAHTVQQVPEQCSYCSLFQ